MCDLRNGKSHRQKEIQVHLIEPTLEDYSGHCYGLVRSFCDASGGLRVTVWGGRGSEKLDFPKIVAVNPLFRRRLRMPQLFVLFLRLLRGGGRVVVMTARRGDLLLARLAAGRALPPGRLFFYFHWYRETPRRLAFLEKAARAQPEVTILATTQSVADTFSRAGFRNVLLLPYPLTATPAATADAQPFTHLLYAGAARQDKGFGKVVALVERLREQGEHWPISVQVSADHYGKYDDQTLADIARLERCDYPGLRLIRNPLSPSGYSALFPGGICLQPYDRSEFRDRASGVTMDALVNGCPVIAPSGTWIAELVTRNRAGVVLEEFDPDSIIAAARRVIEGYTSYRNNALAGGAALQARSWEPLLAQLRATVRA